MSKKIVAEYFWLDHKNQYRSKVRVLEYANHNSIFINDVNRKIHNYIDRDNINSYPKWNYDGSSTGDIPENNECNTECLLVPTFLINNPFKKSTDKVIYRFVYCINKYKLGDTYYFVHPEMANYNKLKTELECSEYIFGIEQEFFILDKETGLPPGLKSFENVKQGNYYCGNGINNINTRNFILDTQEKLFNADINITGFNYEVAPGQAEFQICGNGSLALWYLIALRYILIRNGEEYGYHISFDNIIYDGDNINNSGCHFNISNKKTRGKDGIKYIMEDIEKLETKTPKSAIKFNEIFGEGNTERLTGKLETSKWDVFTWDYGTRHTSIRIPNQVIKDNKGYFEDRRPGGNVNPFKYVNHLLF
jgi:glutamine synthetase